MESYKLVTAEHAEQTAQNESSYNSSTKDSLVRSIVEKLLYGEAVPRTADYNIPLKLW